MSQFFIQNNGGTPPPPGTVGFLSGDIGTNPVGPDGANNINLFGDPTAPGIITRGDAGSNTVFFQLEQPNTCGIGTTINGSTVDLVTLPLGASPASYTIEAIATGKAATASGIGGTMAGTFRTDGVTATLINTVDLIVNRDLVLSGATFNLVASGNNVVLRVNGIIGTVINWSGCMTYILAVGGI